MLFECCNCVIYQLGINKVESNVRMYCSALSCALTLRTTTATVVAQTVKQHCSCCVKVPLAPRCYPSRSLACCHSRLKDPASVCVCCRGGNTTEAWMACWENSSKKKKPTHGNSKIAFIDQLALVPATRQCPIQTAQKLLRAGLTANLGRLLLAQRLHFKWSKVCVGFMVSSDVNINAGAGVFFCVVI